MALIVTSNLTHEYHAARAKLRHYPGNNSDPTATVTDLVGTTNASLSGFSWVDTSGWDGAGTIADPYGLVFQSSQGDNKWYLRSLDSIGSDSANWSFDFWAWTPSPSTGMTFLHTRTDADDDGIGVWCYPTTGTVCAYVNGTSAYYIDTGTSSPAIHGGAWHHVGVTYNQTDLQLYIDGAKAGTTRQPTHNFGTGGHVNLGGFLTTDGTWYAGDCHNGGLTGARFYSATLTPAEMWQNYRAGPRATSLDTDMSVLLALGVGI